jgi:peptidyl-prolyl cis-trans isomerase C
MPMKLRLLREPFVHFLVLGALIFGAYAWLDGGRATQNSDNRIVIDQGELDHLTSLWKLQWKRDPAPSDVAAIIGRHLRQEIFYREALKMNLDHNDGIIKKRLAQKMEAIADDLSTLMRPPTDKQLRQYYKSRADFFELPKAYDFKQILYLPDETDGLEATLITMRRGADVPRDRMNKLSVPVEWSLTSVGDIDNAFGEGFAGALDDLPVGEWSGPVQSGYGSHLVFIEQKEGPRVPDFEEVRDYVAREYEYRSVLETQDQVYKELLDKYEVSITAENVPAEIRAEFTR